MGCGGGEDEEGEWEWEWEEEEDEEWEATFPKYTFRGDRMRTPDPLTNICGELVGVVGVGIWEWSGFVMRARGSAAGSSSVVVGGLWVVGCIWVGFLKRLG